MKNKLRIYCDYGSMHSSHQEDLDIHEQIGIMVKHHQAGDIYFFEFTPIYEVVNWKNE